jgi:hypothetical protein
MHFAGINYWAVLLAAAASFVFGGTWYGFLSKPWLAAIGKTQQEIKVQTAPMAVLLAITIVAELVMAWTLAGVIGHLGPGQVTLRNGTISGGFVWLGFVITTQIINHAYQGAKGSLTIIDGGHWLGVLLIQGAVIGWIGLR